MPRFISLVRLALVTAVLTMGCFAKGEDTPEWLRKILRPDPTPEDVVEVAFSTNRLELLLARRGGRVEIWDTVSQTTVREFAVKDASGVAMGETRAVAFTANGSHAALVGKSSGGGQMLVLMELNTGRTVAVPATTLPQVNDLAFSPDGGLMAGATQNGQVLLWDKSSPLAAGFLPEPVVIDTFPAPVSHLTWSPVIRTTPGVNSGELVRLAVGSADADIIALYESRRSDGGRFTSLQRTHRIPFFLIENDINHRHQFSWSADGAYVAALGIVPGRFAKEKPRERVTMILQPVDYGIVLLSAESGSVWRFFKCLPWDVASFAFSSKTGDLRFLVQEPDSMSYAVIVDPAMRREKKIASQYFATSPAAVWHPSGAYAVVGAGQALAVVQPVHDSLVLLRRPEPTSTHLESISSEARYMEDIAQAYTPELREKVTKRELEKRAAAGKTIPDPKRGILQVIIAGVDHYKSDPLQNCVSESNLLVEALRRQAAPLFKEVRCLTLRNDQATRQGISLSVQAAIEDLRQASRAAGCAPENNVILFFYAGHGSRITSQAASELNVGSEEGLLESDEFYLCPADFFGRLDSATDLKSQGLPCSTIVNMLEAPDAAKSVLVILSSCNAGGAVPWVALGKSSTQGFFLAAEASENSNEVVEKHRLQLGLLPASIFGHALISSLTDATTDANRDGVITLREWQARTTLDTAAVYRDKISQLEKVPPIYPVCFYRGENVRLAVSADRVSGGAAGNFVLLPLPEQVARESSQLESRYQAWLAASGQEKSETRQVVARLAAATPQRPYINSLGQRFVHVPLKHASRNAQGETMAVAVATCETRVQDFAQFVKSKAYKQDVDVKDKWENAGFKRLPGTKQGHGVTWNLHYFEQGPNHPVVCVSWKDADAYHAWLTVKERAAGLLPANARYKLASDHEWSCAAGIGLEENPQIPPSKQSETESYKKFAAQWPSPKSDNFAGPGDSFKYTSPVDSFPPSASGFHSLLGNVEEMCEGTWDEGNVNPGGAYDAGRQYPLIRGESFITTLKPDYDKSAVAPAAVRSFYSWRNIGGPNLGFRSVIEFVAESP